MVSTRNNQLYLRARADDTPYIKSRVNIWNNCIKLIARSPEANSREPVSWSSEEISVSRGNFLGKMQSVHEARVVRSTGSELREVGRDGVGRCGGSGDWGGGGRREEGGGRR